MARIRITEYANYPDMYKAEIRSIAKSGTIDAQYIREEKKKEVKEYGFAYVNQPKERVV